MINYNKGDKEYCVDILENTETNIFYIEFPENWTDPNHGIINSKGCDTSFEVNNKTNNNE